MDKVRELHLIGGNSEAVFRLSVDISSDDIHIKLERKVITGDFVQTVERNPAFYEALAEEQNSEAEGLKPKLMSFEEDPEPFLEKTTNKENVEYILEREYNIPLSEFTNSNTWHDCSIWQVLVLTTGGYTIVNPDAVNYNSKAKSFPSRSDSYPFNILVKTVFKDSDFDEMGITVSMPEDWEFVSKDEYAPKLREQPSRYRFPTMVIDGPDEIKAGGFVSLTLSCLLDGEILDKELTLYLTHRNGYIPKQILTFTGSVSFKAMALGLDPGDEIVIKAGHKYWTNVVSKTLRVVS